MFTQEQNDKYLESCGSECPYCGGNNLSADYIDVDGMQAWRRVDCLNAGCLQQWTEVFRLSEIE